MRTTKTILLMVAAGLVVQGCSWLGIRDRANDYRKAEAVPRIQVPEGLDSSAINDVYPIPANVAQGDMNEEFVVPRADLLKQSSASNVRAFRSGGRFWIVTNDAPGSAWARVRRFWELNGIELEAQDPNSGMLETVWLSRKSGEAISNNKFRMRVEHGMRENSAEIELMHIGFPNNASLPANNELDWSGANKNEELSLSVMKEVAAFLIETEYEAGSVSLLAQGLLGSPKSSLIEEAGQPVLVMRLDFNRAWESVKNGLANAKIEVADQDRSAGLFYLKLVDESGKAKSSSWFSFGSDEPETLPVNLQVQSSNGRVEVRVQGEEPEEGFARKLLTRLRNNLL